MVTRSLPILLILLTTGLVAQCRDGYVRAQDGKIYEGRVRFESNAVVVVDAARELWERIPMTNVATVGLKAWSSGRGRTVATRSERELPEPWRSVDVGSVEEAGTAVYSAGGFQVGTSGTNLFGGSDSFHFVYKRVQGDSQLLGLVAAVEDSHPLAQSGFTMRDGLAADARQVTFVLSARRGGFFGARAIAGEAAEILHQRPMRSPQWIKLTRHGDLFSAFHSGDGRNWSVMGRTVVVMAEEIVVGVGAVGIREGVLAGSRVAQVQEGRLLAVEGLAPQVRLVGGSTHVAQIESIDDSMVSFTSQGGGPLATRAVANIQMRPVPQRSAGVLNAGQPGAILASGDFVAGEIRGVRNGQVTVSSIPLGLLKYDLGTEVTALVFRKPGRQERRPCKLTTADGAVWRAGAMTVEGSWVVLREAAFGVRRVPMHEVIELEWSLKS